MLRGPFLRLCGTSDDSAFIPRPLWGSWRKVVNDKRIENIGEFGWLKKVIPKLYWPSSLNPQLCIGAGDDAGVMRLTQGKVLVASTDAMVEGTHFERRWFSMEDLGYKILAVNLSDLAAMGRVKPLAALVTAGFPGGTSVRSLDQFYKGLESCAQRWKTGLLGGDTVGSKKGWFVSVTVWGEASSRDLIKRSGARAGDVLAVSGPLGSAAAGLEVLQRSKRSWKWTSRLVKAFSRPEPRFELSTLLSLRRWATSLMDCSDGLEASVNLLAEASGLGAEVIMDSLPTLAELGRWAKYSKRAPVDYALKGGEDYQLVFTVPERSWQAAKKALPGMSRVGRMLPKGRGVWGISGTQKARLTESGFAHFA